MKVLLLGYEDIRVKSSPSPSELHADLDLVHVAVQPTFNVLRICRGISDSVLFTPKLKGRNTFIECLQSHAVSWFCSSIGHQLPSKFTSWAERADIGFRKIAIIG